MYRSDVSKAYFANDVSGEERRGEFELIEECEEGTKRFVRKAMARLHIFFRFHECVQTVCKTGTHILVLSTEKGANSHCITRTKVNPGGIGMAVIRKSVHTHLSNERHSRHEIILEGQLFAAEKQR